MKLFNFEIQSSCKLSKIGHQFRKYSALKIDVIKNLNNKKCAPEFVFSNENFDWFYEENWLWESNFSTFYTSPLNKFSKFNDFSQPQLIFLPKFFLILYLSQENSKTGIAI